MYLFGAPNIAASEFLGRVLLASDNTDININNIKTTNSEASATIKVLGPPYTDVESTISPTAHRNHTII